MCHIRAVLAWFFFSSRRRHTRLVSDWSSDVCSSDLALDALITGIHCTKVNYIFDADLRSFFDSVSQQWLIRFLKHRINDTRMIRLIQKWLKAGVLEDGVVTVSEKGTGQGSVISPLLANVYLHYVFDLWAERWRRHEATGGMMIVRYADDIVVGFAHEVDARRFWDAMRKRFEEFALSLLGGVWLKKGDRIMAMLAAANMDPETNPHPERLDLARRPNRHLSFGTGIHF